MSSSVLFHVLLLRSLSILGAEPALNHLSSFRGPPQETYPELPDPAATREFFEKYMSVDEVIAVLQRDMPFFQSSGGGVTIAGGEPSMHYRFSRELVRKCRENSIHTTFDTCGYAIGKPARLLAEADLLLYDLKLIDEEAHIRLTGVGNRPILDNLRVLVEMRKPIIVRVPIVPGLTDSDENISGIGSLLSGLDTIQRVDLIAFHKFAISKYAVLNKSNVFDSIEPPTGLEMDRIKLELESFGLKVQLGG